MNSKILSGLSASSYYKNYSTFYETQKDLQNPFETVETYVELRRYPHVNSS